MQEVFDDKHIFDDDQYINFNCKTKKNKIALLEKIFIFLMAFLSLPGGYFIYLAIYSPGSFVLPLENNVIIYSILFYVLSYVLLVFSEFAFKNFAIKKGIFSTSILSFFLSFFICLSFLNLYGVSVSLNHKWFITTLIVCAVYVVSLMIVRISLVIAYKAEAMVLMVIGPKDDAITFAKNFISNNKRKKDKIRYLFYVNEQDEVNPDIYQKFLNVNTIVLLESLKGSVKQKFLLFFSSNGNKEVFVCSSYIDIIENNNHVTQIGGRLALRQDKLKIDPVESFFKRIMDIVLSLLLLIISLPIWIIIPICIKLDSKGPVFFKQERYTKGMKAFKILKFRSMNVDADQEHPASASDDRVTKVGKFIRKFRIDEIPQVLNVLKGDMSFVGPRAIMDAEYKECITKIPEYKYRFNVKTGITGLQQVRIKPGVSHELKLKYDLYYISNYSLILDLKILFLTIKTVLSKSMSEGIVLDIDSITEFLTLYNKEYNEHDGYLRIINHKREYNGETTTIIHFKGKINKRTIKKMRDN